MNDEELRYEFGRDKINQVKMARCRVVFRVCSMNSLKEYRNVGPHTLRKVLEKKHRILLQWGLGDPGWALFLPLVLHLCTPGLELLL